MGRSEMDIEVIQRWCQDVAEDIEQSNKIVDVLDLIKKTKPSINKRVLACHALAVLFQHLLADNFLIDQNLQGTNDYPAKTKVAVNGSADAPVNASNDQDAAYVLRKWLLQRLNELRREIALSLISVDLSDADTKVLLQDSLELIKAERSFSAFGPLLVQPLLTSTAGLKIADFFVSKFLDDYVDVQFYFFKVVASAAEAQTPTQSAKGDFSAALCRILTKLKYLHKNGSKCFVESTDALKREKMGRELPAHFQSCWSALLGLPLHTAQRHQILSVLETRVLPHMKKPQMFLDFLSDCFEIGGNDALLSLSGIYSLILTKNVDYPRFYTKLYSLLTSEVFYSKYKERFFVLLQTFLMSRNLSASLIASFIKRLAQLALLAPPSGIIVVIPLIYNLMKQHVSCKIMIHRNSSARGGSVSNGSVRDTPVQAESLHGGKRRRKDQSIENGVEDIFDATEPDPLHTGAIDSSLWELEALMGHYHHSVALLARVFREPLTRNRYDMDNFIHHTYSSLIENEMKVCDRLLAQEKLDTIAFAIEFPTRSTAESASLEQAQSAESASKRGSISDLQDGNLNNDSEEDTAREQCNHEDDESDGFGEIASDDERRYIDPRIDG